MKIYFDTCCYGRHWDNQNAPQISADTTAIDTIIDVAKRAGHRIIGSDTVLFELNNIRDNNLRMDIMAFYESTICDRVYLTSADLERAQLLEADGVGAMDSRHLAAAEAADAKFLITTDGDFEQTVTKKNLSRVNVIHPLTYIAEGR